MDKVKTNDGSLDYAATQSTPSFFGADPALEMMRLVSRIAMDRPPDLGIDGGKRIAYIHALSPDDTAGNIARGAELHQEGFADYIFVLGLGRKYKGQYGARAMADDEPAHPTAQMMHSGWREWMRLLDEEGVPKNNIGILQLENPEYQEKYYHTHTEAVSLVKMIKASDALITRLIVVSAAWHIVRAACEVVSQVIVQGLAGEDRFLPVYIAPAWGAFARAWTEAGLGSQSTAGALTPLQELGCELGKIKKYCGWRDLKTAQEILAYFDRRDARCDPCRDEG